MIPNNQAISVLDILDANGIYYEVANQRMVFILKKSSETNESFCFPWWATHLPSSPLRMLKWRYLQWLLEAKLELLHITYVDSIRAILEEKNLEVLKKLFVFIARRASCIRVQLESRFLFLGDLASTTLWLVKNNIEVNHKNAQKGIVVAHVDSRAWDFF